MSTIVLAIQNAFLPNRGVSPPAPAPPAPLGAADWLKKQLKTLAGWLKALAGKAAAALPGVIGTIVSWRLRITGSVAIWLTDHVWALAAALVAAAAVFLGNYRRRVV